MGIKLGKNWVLPNDRFWKGKDKLHFYTKQHPEVTPVAVIAAFVYANVPWVTVYMCLTRDYALVTDPNDMRIYAKVDLENPPKAPKLLKFNEVYNPQPELARIYREMDEEERRQGCGRE